MNWLARAREKFQHLRNGSAISSPKNAPRTSKQISGALAEDQALDYLQQRGLQLVERNFRCKNGEIDLIMRDTSSLIFIEVRQRADAIHGTAAASVTPAKQRRLLHAAQLYLQRYGSAPPCRFDVIAIDGNGAAQQLQWLRDAIQLG